MFHSLFLIRQLRVNFPSLTSKF